MINKNMDKKKYDYALYKLLNGSPMFLKDPLFCELGEKQPAYIQITAVAPVWSTRHIEQAQSQASLLQALGEGNIEIIQLEYQYTLLDIADWLKSVNYTNSQ